MKNAIMKVKFEAIGDEPDGAAAARLKQAAKLAKLDDEDPDGLAYQRQNAPLRPQRNFIGKEQAK